MATITLRAVKASPLTIAEVDNNFNNLNTDKVEVVDAVSTNTANKVVRRDSSGNFSAGTITASLSGTATQVSSTLTRGTYLTGNDFNGAAATTWAVDATSDNTASKVVARDASGNFAAGIITVTDLNSTSDRNQKDNISSITNPIETLNQIEGVSFNWKLTGDKSYGVIAQELQKILPELVTETNTGLAVSYTPLIAFLIEALKNQEKRIKELELQVSRVQPNNV